MELLSFLQYLAYEKRYSTLTVEAYKSDLNQFSSYLLNTYEVSDNSAVNRNMIKSWVVELSRNGLSPASIQRKLVSLKSYFKFLKLTGKTVKNPAGSISSPKKKKPLLTQFSHQQIEALISNLPSITCFASARTRCIIVTLYGTGMRRAELINMQIKDIDLQNKELTITGKRSKKRTIPVPAFLIQEWEQYLFYRRSIENTEANNYMFLTNKGAKLYPVFVNRVIDQFSDLLFGIHPHAYRHSLATHLLENNASLLVIRDLLGHSSLASTQVYTSNSIDQLKKIYLKAHPLAEDK